MAFPLPQNHFPVRPPGSSLRRRLLFLLLSLILLIWGLAGYMVWWNVHEEVDEVMDTKLANSARLLLTLTRHELEEAMDDPEEAVEFKKLKEVKLRESHYEYELAFRIYDIRGVLLIASPNAPPEMLPGEHAHFEDHRYQGENWRTLTYFSDVGSVTVGMPMEPREEIVEYVVLNSLWPIPLSLAVIALLVWWAVGQGLNPLDRVAAELVQRDANDLRQLHTETPQEVRPLVDALNRLLERLQRALANERRFTSDAAHELRTPLAAIKVQAEVALGEQDGERRARALGQVIAGIDRATHLVEQLLTMARADNGSGQGLRMESIDLRPLARDVVGQLGGDALSKGVELELEASASNPFTVYGDRHSLQILLRNLVDNAVKYTPDGGQVLVRLFQEEGRVVLSVSDNGPGIPPNERELLFERFRRGRQKVAGSGLGLSIVKRIAELHHLEVYLDTGIDGNGLGVSLRFDPLPPQAG